MDFPGAIQHVFSRGNEKRAIFLDERDRHTFLDRLGTNLVRWNIQCIAWALMPNHFHLLVGSEASRISDFMRCLLTGFAIHFNHRHERVGHLFQNRYKSRLMVGESQLRIVIRYIHRNPLRSGLVRSLEELDAYPWTGHAQLERYNHLQWQDREAVRRLFAEPGIDGLDAYREFMAIGEPCLPVKDGVIEKRDGGAGESGDGKEDSEVLRVRFLRILKEVSDRSGLAADRIVGSGRDYASVSARRQVLVACRQELGVPVGQACDWLGIHVEAGKYLLRSSRKRNAAPP